MRVRPVSRGSFATLLLGIVPFVLLFGIWQLLVEVGTLNPFLASSPDKVFSSLWNLLRDGTITQALKVSMIEFGIGFGLALVVGVVVGVLTGWYRRLEYLFDPVVWLLYSTPVIALYPVLTLTLGLGRPTVIAITFLLTVPTIVVNSARGVKEVDPLLIRAARSFCASDPQIFTRVALPAAVPLVMAGVRLGIGRALVGVVIGEFFAGIGGLGYNISKTGQLFQTPEMIAQVLVVAVLGIVLTQLLNLIERRIDAWRPSVRA